MELIAFRASHFRSLYETDWIPFHDITVLIGENDGGKTATIEALDVLLGNRRVDTEDFSYSHGELAEAPSGTAREKELLLEARFRVTETEMEHIRAAAPLAMFEDEDLHLVRRANLGDDGPSLGDLKVKARAPADPRLHRDKDRLRLEELRQFADERGLEVTGPRNNKDSFIEAIINTRDQVTWDECELEVGAAAQLGLPVFTVFPSFLDPEQVVSQGLRSVFAQEIQKEEHQGRLEEIRRGVQEVLDGHIANLIPYVRKYRQDIADVRVTPQFDFERGYQGARLELIAGNGRPIALGKRGLGMRRQVTLAVYEWNSEVLRGRVAEETRPVVLAFDEPDLHLDYGSQRKLFDIIRGFTGSGIQVVVATHSLNFVNRVPVNKLNHYSLDSSERTEIEHVPSGPDAEELFLFQVGAGMGLENSLMFYERCFLVVEGATEMGALPSLFERHTGTTMWSEGIRLLNGKGNGGVRLFAKFLNQSRRNVVFLVDEDAKTQSGSERMFSEERLVADGFDIDGQVHFLGPREFEEAFADEVWAKVGRAFYPREGEAEWRAAEFEQMRQETERRFKDSLLRAFRTDPATLGVRLAQCVESSSEIPDAIRTCFGRARQMANRAEQE